MNTLFFAAFERFLIKNGKNVIKDLENIKQYVEWAATALSVYDMDWYRVHMFSLEYEIKDEEVKKLRALIVNNIDEMSWNNFTNNIPFENIEKYCLDGEKYQLLGKLYSARDFLSCLSSKIERFQVLTPEQREISMREMILYTEKA